VSAITAIIITTTITIIRLCPIIDHDMIIV
jgi:hypothetical protein